jgi:serine protease AprX
VNAVYGIRWDDGKRIRIVAALLSALVAIAVFVAMSASAGSDRSMASLVVSGKPGSVESAAKAVQHLGGTVGQRISLINGFLAKVPSNRVAELRTAPSVLSAVIDRPLTLSGDSAGAGSPGASLEQVKQEIGADKLAKAGFDGSGVDIAMIDSGVVPAPGLSQSKVYVGPDFSPEAADPAKRGLDTYGHGTHLAGIMVGSNQADGFSGVAPGARLVSVKAAAADGSTNLGELLQAISWVVSHRQSDGLNIRVLNLSVGSPLSGDYTADPLAYAAEQAWKAGIAVVAAAGNGNDVIGLDTPAADPYVIATGATSMGASIGLGDNGVPSWSRLGTTTRAPDVVGPGTSIVSLRDEGSFIDQNHPEGLVGKDYFKGSGTSQAAAVVSGAVGLLLDENPSLTPDQVKALFVTAAQKVPGVSPLSQGAGQIDVDRSVHLTVPAARQLFRAASLSAILQANRSQDVRVDPGGTGRSLSASRWSASKWSASKWSASKWSASKWSASKWSDNSWGDTTP